MSALVRRGYARKKSDPDDRRSAVFTISAKGIKFYAEVIASGSTRQTAIIETLGLERYNQLNDMLQVLIAKFGPQDTDIDDEVE